MSFDIPQSVALELVPRSFDEVLSESKEALEKYPWIKSINIPEIMSVKLKSFETAKVLLENNIEVTPHFRLIDRSLFDLLKNLEILIEKGLKQVLLIGGDTPTDPSFRSSGLTTICAVKEVKREFPDLKIYTGIDPYRTSFRKELDYTFEKIEAGSDGFFTQPFFSLGMLELWLEQLPEQEIYFGIAPIYSDKSRIYWETRNKVVFPPNFSYDVKQNVLLARILLNSISKANQKAYLMPVRVSALEYLSGL